VTAAVYLFYGRSMGNPYMGGLAAVLIVALLFSLEYAVGAMYATFVGWWAADKFRWNLYGDPRWYLAVFASIGVVNALFTYARSLSFYYTARNASQRMHQNLLAKVMRLPMSFFDSTPTGRIINRFSKDTETLDSLLPLVLMQTFACLFQILSSFVIIAIASLWFLVGLSVIVPAYYLTQRYYIPAAIEVQRLEAIVRRPSSRASRAGTATDASSVPREERTARLAPPRRRRAGPSALLSPAVLEEAVPPPELADRATRARSLALTQMRDAARAEARRR
jgi:ATP-binding cassette subfamily C (CFTR/MRP) protein 1